MDQMTSGRRLEDVGAGRAKVAPRQFAHIVLNTADVPRLRDWYAAFLGAEVVVEDEMGCFMSFDDEHHRIAIGFNPEARPRETPFDPATVAHFAYSYSGLGELLFTYRRLKAAGISPLWSINHGMTVSFYYCDPDNNVVEVQTDVFPTGEAAKAWMRREIPSNPIGVTFDPEEMISAYEAGASIEDLMRRRDLRPGESFLEHLPDVHPLNPQRGKGQ